MPRFSRRLPLLILLGILALAAVLRFTGLKWGIPTPRLPHIPFQIDETFAVDVIREMDLPRWKINAHNGHREGAFTYTIWCLAALLSHWIGLLPTYAWHAQPYDASYQALLFTGRLVSVLLDIASTAMVYLVLRALNVRKSAALWGTAVFAVLPFEIIYSRYMRTQTISNFFVLVAIYYSAFIPRRRKETPVKHLFPKIGLFSAMATATRYPCGAVLIFPIALLAYEALERPSWSTAVASGKQIARLVGLWGISFFLIDPFLFLKFKAELVRLRWQAHYGDYDQFKSAGALLDFSKPWIYLKAMIPVGMFPLLWVTAYAAIFFLVFFARRDRKRSFWTLGAAALVNFYAMSKGYLNGVAYVRAMTFLFPFFALFTGLALETLWERFSRHRVLIGLTSGLVAMTIATSAWFDWAYATAMKEESDPRVQLHEALSRMPDASQPRSFGVDGPDGSTYFLAGSVLPLLPHPEQVRILENDPKDYLSGKASPDYIVLAALTRPGRARVQSTIGQLEKTGRYSLVQTFDHFPWVFGAPFDYDFVTEDMSYPFPQMYLLASRAQKRAHP